MGGMASAGAATNAHAYAAGLAAALLSSRATALPVDPLVLALKKGIDAIVQTPLRFEETKLKNEREKLNQKIAAEKAEAEKRTRDKKQEIAAQKAQIELEEQQLKLDRQKLQFQQDRVKITLEIATMEVSELQSVSDAGQREMIIHSLVPSFLQIAAIETVMVTQLIEPKDEEN